MKKRSRKKRFSRKERQAYWIGVGASMSRGGQFFDFAEKSPPKIKKSLINGYHDDNYRDVSRKVQNFGRKRKK